MKVLLNDKGYFTGSYTKIGNITNGVEVYSLPNEYDVNKQVFCKPKNYIEEIVNKIPVYGYAKEIHIETGLDVLYRTEIINEETQEYTNIPYIVNEAGDSIDITKEDVKLVAVNPVTNKIVEDVEVKSIMDIPIIDYSEVIEHKNVTKWTFDEEAYNAYMAELEANPVIPELTDKEKIAVLEKENKELKESIELQKEINDNQDLMLLELLEKI